MIERLRSWRSCSTMRFTSSTSAAYPVFSWLRIIGNAEVEHTVEGPTKIQTVEWICLDLSLALVVKNSPANATDVRDAGLIPGLGRSPEGGHGNPFWYSCLEKPMDRAAWWASFCGVTKNWTRLKQLSMRAQS